MLLVSAFLSSGVSNREPRGKIQAMRTPCGGEGVLSPGLTTRLE